MCRYAYILNLAAITPRPFPTCVEVERDQREALGRRDICHAIERPLSCELGRLPQVESAMATGSEVNTGTVHYMETGEDTGWMRGKMSQDR